MMRVGWVLAGWLVVLALPAAARAWEPVTTLAPDSGHQVAAAQGPSGVAAVAWSRDIDPYHSALEVRVRAPGGDWGPVQTVSVPEDAQNWTPSVTIDRRGDVLVAWDAEQASNPGYEGVRVAFAPAGRPFGAPTLIEADHDGYGAHRPMVAFDPQGGALAMWWQQDGHVHWAARPAGGAFGAPHTLDLGGASAANGATYAIAPSGDAVAAWISGPSVYATLRHPGGGFAPAVPIGGPAQAILVGAGADGTAAVSLLTTDRSGGDPQVHVAVAPGRSSRFSAPEYVAPVFDGTPAVGPDGAVTLIGRGGLTYPYRADGLWAVTRAPGGGWGEPEQVAPFDEGTNDLPAFAFAPDGALRLAWDHYDSVDSSNVIARVLAARRPAGGRFSGAVDTVTTVHDILSSPALAAGAGSAAITAWSTGPFGIGAVQAARDDAAAPAPVTPAPVTPAPVTPAPAAPVVAPAAPAAAASPPAAAPTPTHPAPALRHKARRRRCTVPSLRGLTLRAARHRLRRHHCRLGHVTRPRHHRHRLHVRRQSPRPHARTRSRVRLRLG